jgi:hypothetical protein
MRGGVSGTQAATFGGGFGTMGSAANGHTDLSGNGRAGGRVDGIGHVDQTTRTATQEASRDAGNAKADTTAAGRQAVGAGEYEASHASSSALGSARDAAGSTAATSVTAVGHAEAQGRNVDATGAAAGGLSAAEAPGTKSEPGSAKSSSGTMKNADSLGASPNSAPKRDGRSSAPNHKPEGSSTARETARRAGTHDAPEASVSAAMDSSATG